MLKHVPLRFARNGAMVAAAVATLLTTSCGSITPNTTASSSGVSAVPSSAGGATSANPSASGSGSSTATAAAAQGGTLRAFVSGDPGTLDPALITGYNQNLVALNVLEGLYRLDPASTAFAPALAESAKLDGSTWTIVLKDATFSNGDPVTAQDVKFSFERLVDPKVASPKAALLDSVAGAAEAKAASGTGISGIKVVDDKTLTITLATPDASFQAKLASPNLAVVSEKATKAAGDTFGREVVSAGPFALTGWETNTKLTAQANDKYWDGRPHLDSVEWDVIGDESTRMVNFESGTLDLAWLPPSYYDKYANDPSWTSELGRVNSVHTEMLAVNMTRDPMKNLAARQAICSGVDREAAIASLQGRATVAHTLAPPSLGEVDSGGCTYDVEKAKSLAADGGLTGKTLDLISPNWSNLVQTLTLYQANLKAAGIDVNLVPLDDAAYSDRIAKGDFDLAWTYRVPDYLDADSFFAPLLESSRIGSGNVAQYSDPTVDQELAKALSSSDSSERSTLYANVDRTASDQLPYIPLLHNVYVDIHAKTVTDYTYSALDLPDYSKVSMG